MMSLENLSYLAQIAAALGVIASLVFVGLQIRQNTHALSHTEQNATMGEWSAIRMATVQSGELAELMTAGLSGERELGAAERLRLELYLAEHLWAGFHLWHRTERGVFPAGTFEAVAGALIAPLLATPVGAAWWARARQGGFAPGYVAAVEGLGVGGAPEHPHHPT